MRKGREEIGREPRETRDEWALLALETQANGDSRNTYERSLFFSGSLGSLCRYKRIFSPALAALVGAGRNDFDDEGHWKGWALKIKTLLGSKKEDFVGP